MTTSLSEDQYQLLCEACDGVLLSADSTVERVAIPWLHVVREHPVFLRQYLELFTEASGFRRALRHGMHMLRHALIALRRLSMATWYGSDSIFRAEPEFRIDLLVVSHLLSPAQGALADDFYFGPIAQELRARKHRTLIAMLDHTGQPRLTRKTGMAEHRFVLPALLGLRAELKLIWRLGRESRRLRAASRRETDGLRRRLLERAAVEALSDGAAGALRMHVQIRQLVRQLNPGSIMVTFEGHAWERTAFAAAREARSDIRCLGYQHAALFRKQHAIRRRLQQQYNPDHILASGEASRGVLAGAAVGVPVSVLGSNRNSRCVADKPAGRPGEPRWRTCLVIPEGIEDECRLLFTFSLACAAACPDLVFVWRLHPAIDFPGLLARDPALGSVPSNVVKSGLSLEDDLARSGWALYRGSTAILQAVAAGLRPVYLQQAGQMTIDPLHELACWRATVRSVADFRVLIERGVAGNPQQEAATLRLAQAHCAKMFAPFDWAALAPLLGDQGRA